MKTPSLFLPCGLLVFSLALIRQVLAAPGLGPLDGLLTRDGLPASANHGANCVKTNPGMCTISADFMDDIAGTGADNMFMVFDENCKLDVDSPKTLDPHAANSELTGTPMASPLVITDFIDPAKPFNGFHFTYGSRYPNKIEVKFNPALTTFQHQPDGFYLQSVDCVGSKTGHQGKCFSIQFTCNEAAAYTQPPVSSLPSATISVPPAHVKQRQATAVNLSSTITTGSDRSLATGDPKARLAAPICNPYPRSGMCVVSSSFYPGAGAHDNNVFHVFDGACNLDTGSVKSLNPNSKDATPDWSISGKPMPLSFDVKSWNDPSHPEQGFRWAYGARYPEFSENMPPPRVGEPGGPIMEVVERDCFDPRDQSKSGTCYAVTFECDDKLVETWSKSGSSSLPQPTRH